MELMCLIQDSIKTKQEIFHRSTRVVTAHIKRVLDTILNIIPFYFIALLFYNQIIGSDASTFGLPPIPGGPIIKTVVAIIYIII